ncbi:MAG: hypothetical protein J6331_06215, partial [Lentisphaeria bacterium]|nr:hypothetical protein [Lentisphaeria bacterium]
AMRNAGLPDADSISLADIRDHKKLISYGLNNGDGVVPPEQICVEEFRTFAEQVMALGGKVKDLSGADGIDLSIVNAFGDNAAKYLAWKKAPSQDPSIFARGEATPALYGKFSLVREKVDEFFRLCQLLALAEGASPIAATPLDPMNVNFRTEFMKNAPIAKASAREELVLEGNLNPAWADALRGFFGDFSPEKKVISFADWKNVCAELSPYGKWMESKPCSNFDTLDDAALAKLEQALNEGMVGKLQELIELDKSSGENILCFSQVRKLILFQQNLLEFLNNFVSLKELFDLSRQAMLQHGELIMDGRHFSLVTPLSNIAEHKKLAQRCYICIMYIETSTGAGADLRKRTFAVAVTSGDMNNLFVGKCGVFIAKDGTVWDAKVVDYIQQPVSFSEALKMPFYRFAEMVGKQVDKFFSARSREVETEVSKSFTEAQKFKPAAPPAPGAKSPAMQTPAVSGSMMLMGGGLGLAAIGSSFAFMAQALKNVSVWNVLLVFLCVILIFSGPLVIMSLIKLYRRSIASFLEAGGVAINKRMRLNRKMGAIFTRSLSVPLQNFLNTSDIVNGTFDALVPGKARKHPFWRAVLVLAVILIFSLAGFLLYKLWQERLTDLFSKRPSAVPECSANGQKPAVRGSAGKKADNKAAGISPAKAEKAKVPPAPASPAGSADKGKGPAPASPAGSADKGKVTAPASPAGSADKGKGASSSPAPARPSGKDAGKLPTEKKTK